MFHSFGNPNIQTVLWFTKNKLDGASRTLGKTCKRAGTVLVVNIILVFQFLSNMNEKLEKYDLKALK